jgi:hypothetical protein
LQGHHFACYGRGAIRQPIEDAQPGERHLRRWPNQWQHTSSLDESVTPLLGGRHHRRALFARMCPLQNGNVNVHQRSNASSKALPGPNLAERNLS